MPFVYPARAYNKLLMTFWIAHRARATAVQPNAPSRLKLGPLVMPATVDARLELVVSEERVDL